MDIFNFTHNRLIEMEFRPFHIDGIESVGGVVYKSPVNYVVLKKAHTFEELKNNNAYYSTEIRTLMLDNKLNINNTYLIICTDINVDYETFFIIERDTKALRKYVIRNENDLNRIPFLDNSVKNTDNNIELVYESEENIYLQELLNYIREKTHQQNKLSTKQIEDSVKLIMNKVGDEIENG